MSKNQKTTTILILIAILFLSLGFYALFSKKTVSIISETIKENTEQEKELPNKNIENPETPKTKSKITKNIATNQAYIEINGIKHQSEISENISVYDFMNKARKEGKFIFKEKNYIGIGKFIEEISGVRSDGKKYWIYYVNGKKAQIGVSNYKINPGDVVSWKYEEEIY